MPLDSTLYPHTHLRTDGRRWNELRHLSARISPLRQKNITAGAGNAADGSSYVEMGYTKILGVVHGPTEAISGGGGGNAAAEKPEANVVVEIIQPGFASEGRRRRVAGAGNSISTSSAGYLQQQQQQQQEGGGGGGGGGGGSDRRLTTLQQTVARAMSTSLFLHIYPHSTISISLHALSVDGSLLAACINAATLALVDAGLPMRDYVCACTCALSPALAPQFLSPTRNKMTDGDTKQDSSGSQQQDPLLDINVQEESELPYLTVATIGDATKDSGNANSNTVQPFAGDNESDAVVALILDRRIQVDQIEPLLVAAVDGCRRIRGLVDDAVKEHFVS